MECYFRYRIHYQNSCRWLYQGRCSEETVKCYPSLILIPHVFIWQVRKGESLKWKEETSSGEALVDKERVYRKEPSNAVVDKQDVIPSYKYGSTYIPILSMTFRFYCYVNKDFPIIMITNTKASPSIVQVMLRKCITSTLGASPFPS